jgi:hypothetical protein
LASDFAIIGSQEVLLKYKFAFDEPETLADGTVAEIIYNKILLDRILWMDETDNSLSNDQDASGPRSKTYANDSLNRASQRATRGASHVTNCASVTMAGVPLPPLFIFSSDASEERMAVNDAWTETMGKIRGKWGHNALH